MILYLNNFFSESIDLWVNKVQLVDRGAALSRSFKSDPTGRLEWWIHIWNAFPVSLYASYYSKEIVAKSLQSPAGCFEYG